MSAQPNAALQALLDSPLLWRGDGGAHIRAESTGHKAFDALLPGGGWPVGALSEILCAQSGIGELGLVLPWVARHTQAGGRAAFVAPPHLPFAPALAQAGVVLQRLTIVTPQDAEGALWATEQMLRAGVFGTVLAWPRASDEKALRRLQLAAETGQAIGILFREARAVAQASPAALRLCLSATPAGLDVEIVKCRGGVPGRHWLAAA